MFDEYGYRHIEARQEVNDLANMIEDNGYPCTTTCWNEIHVAGGSHNGGATVVIDHAVWPENGVNTDHVNYSYFSKVTCTRFATPNEIVAQLRRV